MSTFSSKTWRKFVETSLLLFFVFFFFRKRWKIFLKVWVALLMYKKFQYCHVVYRRCLYHIILFILNTLSMYIFFFENWTEICINFFFIGFCFLFLQEKMEHILVSTECLRRKCRHVFHVYFLTTWFEYVSNKKTDEKICRFWNSSCQDKLWSVNETLEVWK